MRRTREQIFFTILKCCATDRLAVTRLMLVSNLSHGLLKSYLAQLHSHGLVRFEKSGRSILVATSTRGMTFVEYYRNLIAVMNEKDMQTPSTDRTASENSKPEQSFTIPKKNPSVTTRQSA